MTTMKTRRTKLAGVTSVSAISLLLLSACGSDDDDGDVDDNGSSVDEANEVEETTEEEAVDAASPEERLDDYWTDGQNAMSEEELQELNEVAFSGPEDDETLEMLTENEELTRIVDEYFAEADISDEKLEEYQVSSTDELVYALALMPAQMDQVLGFAAAFQEDIATGGDGDVDTDEFLEGMEYGAHVLNSDDTEGSDAGTASVEFLPRSMVAAYQSLNEQMGDEEEELSTEEIIEGLAQDGEGVLTYWFVFQDGEWLIDVEATVDELEALGSGALDAEEQPDFEDADGESPEINESEEEDDLN